MKKALFLFVLFCVIVLPQGGNAQHFSLHTSFASHSGENATIAASDLDRDGDIDIVLSRDDSVGIYKNDGNGNFTNVQEPPVEAGTSRPYFPELLIGDFNDDGYPDIFAGVDSMELGVILENDGNGQFTVTSFAPDGTNGATTKAAALYDENNDGVDDLFLGISYQNTDSLVAFTNDGNGNFTQSNPPGKATGIPPIPVIYGRIPKLDSQNSPRQKRRSISMRTGTIF